MNKNANIKSPEQLKDLYGKEYVEKYAAHSLFRLERLMKYVRLDSDYQVADFACGDGMLMPLVAPRVASYVGVDFSEEFVRKANEKMRLLIVANADFFCSDINEFCDSHTDSFDCAFAMDFSEHVYDDERVKILTSIRKSLKKEGRLYIHTPNALFLRHHPGHIAVRSSDENTRLLVKAGYSVKRVLLIPHYNFLRFIHFLSYTPFFGRYFLARIFIEAVK